MVHVIYFAFLHVLFFLANYQLSCVFTLKEFRVYGRLSDLPTHYQMSDHPLRVLIGVIFCWVGNNVTFDSAVIMEYFIDDHCHLQKGKKKEQLKVSQIFSGRSKSHWLNVCLSDKHFQLHSSLKLPWWYIIEKELVHVIHGEKGISIPTSALDACRNDGCFS